MRAISRWVLPVVGAVVMAAPSMAAAQGCNAVDVGVNCELTSTAQTANITPGALGMTEASRLEVRYIGGLAGLSSSLYFFDSFNSATFNYTNPLLNSYTLIGQKQTGDQFMLYNGADAEDGWMSLAGIFDPNVALTFALAVNYDFGTVWLYSGLNANTFDLNGSAAGGSVTYTNSRIFSPTTSPEAPADNPTAGVIGAPRDPSRFGAAFPDATFIGFEDNIFTPDFDFNDGVFQIRGTAVVPEPSSIALVAAGLLGLGIAARRRQQR